MEPLANMFYGINVPQIDFEVMKYMKEKGLYPELGLLDLDSYNKFIFMKDSKNALWKKVYKKEDFNYKNNWSKFFRSLCIKHGFIPFSSQWFLILLNKEDII